MGDSLQVLTPQQRDGLLYLGLDLSPDAEVRIDTKRVHGWEKPFAVWQAEGRTAVLDPDGNFRDPTEKEGARVTLPYEQYVNIVRTVQAQEAEQQARDN